MIAHLWQSTLFVGVAWLATKALGSNRATVRYRIWLAASLKFMVPLSLLVALGRQFEWRAPAEGAGRFWVTAAEQALAPTALATIAPVTRSVDMRTLLLVLWAVGFCLVLWSWWRDYRPIRRAFLAGMPLDPASIGASLRLRTLSVPELREPGLTGVWRPTLLIPQGIATGLSTEQLKTVIAHELCHWQRRDNLTALMHMAVEAIFWFHPAVWWIERRLVEERERACDAAVLAAGHEPRTYAEAILTICRSYVESRSLLVPGVSGANLRRRIEVIMRNERERILEPWKRFALAFGVLVAIGWPVSIGVMNAPPLRAQAPAASFDPTGPAFDVASIKRNVSGEPARGEDVFQPGGVFRVANMTVRDMIVAASQLQQHQVVGGPAWITSERFDIIAKTESIDWNPLDRRPSPSMFAAVRTLMADRFKVAAHLEEREMAVYELRLARSDGRFGPALRRSDIDCQAARSPEAPTPRRQFCGGVLFTAGRMEAISGTMDQVAKNLAVLGRTVINRTGISDRVDFVVEWTPAAARGAEAATGGDPGVSAFTALEEQLGLKLQSAKSMIPVLVIDRVERPTEN